MGAVSAPIVREEELGSNSELVGATMCAARGKGVCCG